MKFWPQSIWAALLGAAWLLVLLLVLALFRAAKQAGEAHEKLKKSIACGAGWWVKKK